MANQIEVTVLNIGTASQTVSFLVDLIYVEEYVSGSANAKIYYFGDPLTPNNPTNIYEVSETVTSIVTASENTLVQATIWAKNAAGKFKESQQFAFPSGGYSIWEQTGDDDINSFLYYRGNQFYAAETQATLIAAANAGGGGGGVESVTGDLVDNADPSNPIVDYPYLIYTATITQSGTDAPVATIHENTVGDIVWTRQGVGEYRGALSGAFPSSTWFNITMDAGQGQYVGSIGKLNMLPDEIQIFTYNQSAEPSDFSKSFIEIRVYP